MSEQRPRILYFKEFIPTPVCILLSLFFAMVFQFNGGVFLPTSTQMSSALGCLREDVMMAGYASFIGMTVIFPILFRLKFRFTTRRIFLTVCPVLIVCNLITMQSQNIAILVATCFVSGFFRMWGTFECFSNIRLSVTPSGNFSVFYPVIYIIVLESIQLSGLVATHLSDWANWQYMHWLVIGLLIVVWFCVFFLTRPFRVAKKMPLYGIDWTGAAGTDLPSFPDYPVPVSDAVSVSHHLIRPAGNFHALHSEIRHAECRFTELVCLCRNSGGCRHCLLSPGRSAQRI